MTRTLLMLLGALVIVAGGGKATAASAQKPFTVTPVAEFDEPWAMTFLPDGRLLVTEKRGSLKLYSPGGRAQTIQGVPKVDYGGQGGLGDVVLHPDFAKNGIIYLSYAEAGRGDTRGAAVARGRLELTADGGRLRDVQVIWRQSPKVTGRGHYGHRMTFGPDGMLWITSGERQKFDPAQDLNANLGKILRLRDDGSPAPDNPFAQKGEVAAQVWTLGHRNPLGIAFDREGRLWAHEMGPRGGDELNLIERGANYGYPIVSQGDHYDGRSIPDHGTTSKNFHPPQITWTPVISPAGFIIYDGEEFPQWRGSGLIGGLSSQALIRVAFDGAEAREVERFDMGQRIREVEQGPEGAVYVLEDEREGRGGRLLKLTSAAGEARPGAR